jgi:hypothetical protein
MAPKLNVLLKTNKKVEPVSPITNNIQAPSYSYKLAKYLNKNLNQLFLLITREIVTPERFYFIAKMIMFYYYNIFKTVISTNTI